MLIINQVHTFFYVAIKFLGGSVNSEIHWVLLGISKAKILPGDGSPKLHTPGEQGRIDYT